MIDIYSGKLRNGKTYHAVRVMMKALAAGQHVFSNVELIWGGVEAFIGTEYGLTVNKEQRVFLEKGDISRFDQAIGWGTPDCPTLVCIDEVHLWLNARDYQKASRDLLNWLTQSGKACVDIIFISQHPENIDAQIRRQTQCYHRFRDMQKLSLKGLGMKWPLPQFMHITFDEDGRTETSRELVWKDARIFACYKTLSFLNGGERTDRLLRAKLSSVDWRTRVKFQREMNRMVRETKVVKHSQ